MIKKLTVFVLSLALLLGGSASLFAKTPVASPVALPSPTPAANVNSFELFWPMVAGKTMQSRLYFLKSFKEQMRGVVIFGSSQKANYGIFLSIKRVLEAEVLMKANLSELTNKTLDKAIAQLESANSSLTSAKNAGDIEKSTKDEINIRVSNLKVFVTSLKKDYPSFGDKLQTVLDRLNALTV